MLVGDYGGVRSNDAVRSTEKHGEQTPHLQPAHGLIASGIRHTDMAYILWRTGFANRPSADEARLTTTMARSLILNHTNK